MHRNEEKENTQQQQQQQEKSMWNFLVFCWWNERILIEIQYVEAIPSELLY